MQELFYRLPSEDVQTRFFEKLTSLTGAARHLCHGVRGFTADVLVGNSRVLRVFRRGDHEVTVTTEGGISEVTMVFSS